MVRIALAGAVCAMLVGFVIAADKPAKPAAAKPAAAKPAAAKPGVRPPSAGEKIDFSDEAVEAGIKKAVAFLWSRQTEDGSWPGFMGHGAKGNVPDKDGITYNPAGPTALVVYALLEAGEEPQNPKMKKALEWLAAQQIERTYSLGLRASAWCSANLYTKDHYLRNLEGDVQLLVASNKEGSYGYYTSNVYAHKDDKRVDNSNAQYGLLGVWAGWRNDVTVPKDYWETVLKHWIRCQNQDGGWAYNGTEKASTSTMAAAGLASMYVCYDNVYTDRFSTVGSNTDQMPANTAIKNGLAWFDKNFMTSLAGGNMGYGDLFYYLYGVERVGLASGRKYFGKVDWYKNGAKKILEQQEGNGSFKGGHYGPDVSASYALLYLVRGRAAVLFNKLEHAPETDWNNRPRDLATLTRWISYYMEYPVNWQSINLLVPVHEWHDAPILYIAGSQDPKFSEDDLNKLREFVYQGGMILSCTEGGGAFGKAMKDVYNKLFPDYELAPVPADHSLYNLHYKLVDKTTGQPRIKYQQVNNGVRTLALHVDEDVPKLWQLNKPTQDRWAYEAGANLFLYVADHKKLRSRGVSLWPDVDLTKVGKSIKVVRVQHAANSDPEPLALEHLSVLLAKNEKVKLDIQTLPLEQLGSSDAKVAFLTGTEKLTLTDEQKQAIKSWVSGGGTLVIDAAGGSKTFAEAIEQALVSTFGGTDSLRKLDQASPVYTLSGHEIADVFYREQAIVDMGGIRSKNPSLQAVYVGERAGVIYSQYDLTGGLLGAPAYTCSGYKPDSCYKLVRNIVLVAGGSK